MSSPPCSGVRTLAWSASPWMKRTVAACGGGEEFGWLKPADAETTHLDFAVVPVPETGDAPANARAERPVNPDSVPKETAPSVPSEDDANPAFWQDGRLFDRLGDLSNEAFAFAFTGA